VPEDAISDMQTFAGRLGAGYVSPESAAALAAVPVLRERGEIEPNEEIVVFDCGIGQKYPPPQDLPNPPVVDPNDLDIDALAHSLRP
jgi:threonine synthase